VHHRHAKRSRPRHHVLSLLPHVPRRKQPGSRSRKSALTTLRVLWWMDEEPIRDLLSAALGRMRNEVEVADQGVRGMRRSWRGSSILVGQGHGPAWRRPGWRPHQAGRNAHADNPAHRFGQFSTRTRLRTLTFSREAHRRRRPWTRSIAPGPGCCRHEGRFASSSSCSRRRLRRAGAIDPHRLEDALTFAASRQCRGA